MMIEKTLSNGIRFVGERIPYFRSVSVGIWVKVGSATEQESENGLSHFLEHMLFKGTKKRSYKDIAQEFDNIGAQSNAYTSKEMTCYYVRAVDEKLYVALDILTDMFTSSVFPEQQVEKERGVILEEIAMVGDTPDELLMERLSEEFFRGTELSKTILGKEENVKSFLRSDLVGYREKHYCTGNIVVAAAGNFDEAELLAFLEEKLSLLPSCPLERTYEKDPLWKPQKKEFLLERDIEQLHLGLSFPGPALDDADRYVCSLVVNILGGGMSSRLFQKVREELGAAYSVYAYPVTYKQGGAIVVYAGTSPKNQETVYDAVIREIGVLKKGGISREELENTKVQLLANYALSQESTSSRMTTMGRNALLLGRCPEEEEIIQKIKGIAMEDVKALLERMFDLEEMVKIVLSPKAL